VLPRSGLAAAHGVGLVNAPGLIDAGYRGEVCVLLLNTDRHERFEVAPGDRVAALAYRSFAPYDLAAADAVVVIAGMEGALASVVGGLTAAPVVAVPTSAGYGSSFDGITALLGMLASCAAGISVIGIDNGYGAACAVLRLLR
jgi:phosphoribosylcarboxyaminoimidazole (NCAIR) mutase